VQEAHDATTSSVTFAAIGARVTLAGMGIWICDNRDGI